MFELTLSRAICQLDDALKQEGVILEQRHDFSNFEQTALKVRGKPVSGEFSKFMFDLHEENAFWTVGSSEGRAISVLATRYENLGRRSLADHLPRQQPRIYPKPNVFSDADCPLLKRMNGELCYAGEFALVKGFEDNGLSSLLVMAHFLLTLQRWPGMNWVWGLMNENLAKCGMAARMGFTHAVPNGVNWEVNPSGVDCTDWLVATPREDLWHWAGIIAERGPGSLLRKQKA